MVHEITKDIHIADDELEFAFIRSSGPGGQNVNKVSTAVQLRFDIHESPAISKKVKERLIKMAGNRVSGEGILIIDARTHRTQLRNKEEALKRLCALVKKAAVQPKRRVPTKPTRQSQEKRLQQKKERGEVKRLRRTV